MVSGGQGSCVTSGHQDFTGSVEAPIVYAGFNTCSL